MSARVAALWEIADLNPSLTSSLQSDQTVAFVPMASVSAETASINIVEERKYQEVAKGYTPFSDGDLLVAKITPCFENSKIAQARLPQQYGFGSTEFHVIRPHAEKSDARYLLHFLRQDSIRRAGERRMTGSAGQRRVPEHFLAELKVPLPFLPEQRRIAAILDKADALRVKRREALAHLDSLAQSIFLEMFGDPVSNPKGWSRQKLGEITQKITDGEHLNPPFSQSGMPIIMAGDVLEDQIDFGSSKMVESDLGYRFRRKCDPEQDDLLIVSRGATIGRLCVVGMAPEFCLMGSVILVKPVKDKINPQFLSVFLKHPASRHALYKTSGSSAQQAIYLKDVKKLVCIVPPISLQREFARRIDRIQTLKVSHSTSLVELNALFSALQHRAFQGEL